MSGQPVENLWAARVNTVGPEFTWPHAQKLAIPLRYPWRACRLAEERDESSLDNA